VFKAIFAQECVYTSALSLNKYVSCHYVILGDSASAEQTATEMNGNANVHLSR